MLPFNINYILYAYNEISGPLNVAVGKPASQAELRLQWKTFYRNELIIAVETLAFHIREIPALNPDD